MKKLPLILPLCLALSLCLLFSSGSAFATPLAVHEGLNNPLDEGWVIYNTGAVPGPGGTETINSVSHDYWQIHDTTSSLLAYGADASDVLNSDWRMEAIVRIVNGTTSGLPGHTVMLDDGINRWGFWFGDGYVGTEDASGNLSMSYDFDTTQDYHHYVVEFFRNNNDNPDDDYANYYIDNNIVFTEVTRDEQYHTTGGMYNVGIAFGTTATVISGTANYEFVSLEGTAPIPEPATMLLLGSGLIGLAGVRRKFRK